MQEDNLQRSSMLVKRLTHRMLTVYLVIYICVLLALCLLLLPVLSSIAVKQADAASLRLHDAFRKMQTDSLEYVDALAALPSLGELLLNYRTSPSEKNRSIVEQYLQTYDSTFDDLLLIIVRDRHENLFTSFRFRATDATEKILKDENYVALCGQATGAYYHAVSDDMLDVPSASGYALPSIAISKNYTISSDVYTISVYFKADSYLSSARAISSDYFSDYWILQNGSSYYSTNDRKAGSFLASVDMSAQRSSGRLIRGDGLYFYSKIFDSECDVVAFVTWIKLLSGFISIFLIASVLYLMSPVLYRLFLTPTISRYLSPLKKLTDTISSYSAGQVIISDIKTGDELELLSNTFNDMMKKINIQIDDIKAFERDNAVTQFRLLTTQIDPHFIYNTMNIINVLARKGDTKAVVEVNSNLIYILQQRLNTKISIFESVEVELRTLKQYQIIMDYRYANNVTIYHDVDEALLSVMILKNILQPLVENAYFHGLSDEDGAISGSIRLSIRSEGDDVILVVSDDGRGISSEKLERIISNDYHGDELEKIHIGLHNIRQRLRYIYQERCTMDILSAPGEGTVVTIRFPVTPAE